MDRGASGLQLWGHKRTEYDWYNWTATTWAAGKNRKYPCPSLLSLSVVRWILGYSLPTEVLQAFLPVSAQNSSYFSNLVSILWESHTFSSHPAGSLQTPPFLKKGRKTRRSPQTTVPLPNGPNCSETNMAKLLAQRQSHLNSWGTFWLRRD